MNKTFAGFWRDGAIVRPEEKHFDSDCMLIAKHKDTKELDICNIIYNDWESVYWLDTTAPTELTPQEAFELLRVINPTLERIEKNGHLYSAYADKRISIINWGDATEYPPKQKWRVPTDADKGKKCRFWDNPQHVRNGMFLCVHPNKKFVVYWEGDFWQVDYCEVLDE